MEPGDDADSYRWLPCEFEPKLTPAKIIQRGPAEIHTLQVATTAAHDPDDILERAKGKGFEAVIVLGFHADKPLDIRASTSDVERIVFMLECAKQTLIESVREQGGAG